MIGVFYYFLAMGWPFAPAIAQRCSRARTEEFGITLQYKNDQKEIDRSILFEPLQAGQNFRITKRISCTSFFKNLSRESFMIIWVTGKHTYKQGGTIMKQNSGHYG